jgi:DNA (cytosine-5)-methyltransferase 1
MTYRVLDLFSGLGAFSLGLERTGGFQTVGFCEIDPFCRRVLAKHWPDVPCADDITTREFKEGEADVITAGWPCQDISYAGPGTGLAGERSGLFREVVRAVRLVRPLHAILENVAALLGRGMGTVLGDLASVGYDAEWHCIPAGAVGASHERDRVWIIADATEIRRSPLLLDEQVAQAFEGGQSTRVGAQDIREWPSEAVVCRASDGLPNRLDRVAALGNSLYPQIPEIIGRAILSSTKGGVNV